MKEGWMQNDEWWRMKDEGWWFQAVEGFCRRMDGQTFVIVESLLQLKINVALSHFFFEWEGQTIRASH